VAAGTIADGSLDPAFGSNGTASFLFDLGGNNRDTAPSAAIDSSDRVVTFAEVARPNGIGIGMARRLSNGAPRLVSNLSNAPLVGEAALLYALSQTPAKPAARSAAAL
jgi:hypothetical protein